MNIYNSTVEIYNNMDIQSDLVTMSSAHLNHQVR